MFELSSAQFDRVKPLFDTTQPLATMIFSPLDGRTPGRVFVDDPERPTNCLLVTPLIDMSFTHATVDQEWLHETVAAVRQSSDVLLNWPSPFATRLQLPPGVDDSNSGYEFLEYSPQGDFQLPADRHFRPLDAELFANCDSRELVLMEFGTFENFLANGMSVCVMDGETICSEACAVYLGAGKFEMGVFTYEEYRRQGNGLRACKRLIEMIEERGYAPHWSYLGGNERSPALARKLGFRAQREFGWYHYPQIV